MHVYKLIYWEFIFLLIKARSRLVRVCASTDVQSSTIVSESSVQNSNEKTSFNVDSRQKNNKDKKTRAGKTGFVFGSKKSKEKKKSREARKKKNAQREEHFRRQMRSGAWNKKYDSDDENYEGQEKTEIHDENYNECGKRYCDPETIYNKKEIYQKGNIVSGGNVRVFS